MEAIVSFLNGFNFQTIFSLGVIVWYFTHSLERKIDRQSERTDRLYEMFIEMAREKK